MEKKVKVDHSEIDKQLDLKLKKIIETIKTYPQKSIQGRRAWNNLFITIQTSGKLSYPKKSENSWSGEYYEYLRNQAISKTFESMFKNIDSYNPDYLVMQWVNGILKNRFIDVLRKEKPNQNLSIHHENAKEIPDDKSQKEDIWQKSDRRKKCIENSSTLQEKHIRGKDNATVAKLIIMKYFEEKTFEDIALEFNIPTHSTISSFLYRQIKMSKIDLALRKCLQEE